MIIFYERFDHKNYQILMKPKERQKDILSLIRGLHREWPVKDLASELHVSELTIRRDLKNLAKSGDIIRTHGGCVTSGNGLFSTYFYKQFGRNFELKNAIGEEAASLVNIGDTILLGDGSTTFQFAAHLENRGRITVYTNSIPAIQELKKCPNIHLYVLGGQYDLDYDMLLLKGSLADRMLETHHFDLIIIGTDAIDDKGYCLLKTEEAARTYQIILRRGDRKILLADHTKVGTTGNVVYGKLSDFDLWITTAGIDEELMNNFRKQTSVREVKIKRTTLARQIEG